MTRGAVLFDVDGTLVPYTSSGQHLAQFLGHADIFRQVAAGYSAGTLSSEEAAVLDARGWATWTPKQVRGFLASLPVVEGIAEVVLWCRQQGLAPVLATLAWDVVGAHLCERFGFDRACGPSLEVIDGRYSGEIAELYDELRKRDFAISVAAELGVELSCCAAVGDGRSDVPLFAEVGVAIALNAAHVSINGTDLRAVLPILDAWLNSGPTSSR